MDEYTLIDGIVAAVILLSAILAYSRGLVREILSIAGWVIAAVLAFIFAPQVEPLIREIPGANDLFGTSCELSIIAAFAGVFGVALIVTSIFTPIFAGMVHNSVLGGLDQGMGFLFGAVRGVILVLVALVAYTYVGSDIEMVELSKTKEMLAASQEKAEEMIPTEAPEWIVKRYEDLTQSCGVKEATSSDTTAN